MTAFSHNKSLSVFKSTFKILFITSNDEQARNFNYVPSSPQWRECVKYAEFSVMFSRSGTSVSMELTWGCLGKQTSGSNGFK